MKIDQSHIVLTGAASGIGQALLTLLAGRPAQIIAADKNAEGVQAACAALAHPKARIIPTACDLSTPAAVERLFEQALADLGSIDLFIANAGFAYYEEITQPDWAHIEQIYRVNAFAPLYILQKMQVLHGEQPYKVVITASAMAHIGVPGYALYSSTKAALDRFADAYRWQMRDPRQLMLAYPIATRTTFFHTAGGSQVPVPWPSQTPEAVARAILWGIEHDQMRVYPSRVFRAVLLITPVFPPLRWLVQRLEQRRFEKWRASHSREF